MTTVLIDKNLERTTSQKVAILVGEPNVGFKSNTLQLDPSNILKSVESDSDLSYSKPKDQIKPSP